MSRLSTGLTRLARQGIEKLTHADQRVVNDGIDTAILEQPPSVLGSGNVRFSVQRCGMSARASKIHAVRTNFNVGISGNEYQQ